VFAIGCVAEMLCEDEQRLQTIADEKKPEDGCLAICETDDLSTTAFTPFGIERLKELMPLRRRQTNEGWDSFGPRRRAHRMDTPQASAPSSKSLH
jgi:hypothetical protein